MFESKKMLLFFRTEKADAILRPRSSNPIKRGERAGASLFFRSQPEDAICSCTATAALIWIPTLRQSKGAEALHC
jgi:hypothetical protein